MPKRTQGRALFAEQYLARRIALERERRSWNYDSLSLRTEQAGCKIHASALWKIEKGDPPRRITVDELVVLSKVFNLPMADLVADPELQMPAHLSAVAEQAANLSIELYRIRQEEAEVAKSYGDAIRELREGLATRPELADSIAQRIESSHPAWVVGREEADLASMVMRAVRPASEKEESGDREDA